MNDNRRRYRADVGGLELLDLRLIVPGSGTVHGEVLDLCFEGVGARFDPDHCPRLPAGEPVKLAFSMHKQGRGIVVAAVVQHRREEGEHRRYGFRFVDLEDLQEKLDGEMLGLFNRRQVLRVRPEESHPIEVVVLSGEHHLLATAINVSELGMAISVPSGLGAEVEIGAAVQLAFRLPEAERDLELAARLVHRTGDPGAERWGLEFQESDLARDGAREALREFVLRRRRTMVQQLGVESTEPEGADAA